jgi:hypothetical protein
VAHELADAQRRSVARRQLHAREFRQPLRDRVFERQLSFIAQLQNRQSREALGHRRNPEHRGRRDPRIARAFTHPRRFHVRQALIDHHSPHHPRNLPVAHIFSEDLIDLRHRRLKFANAIWISEARRRVSVAGQQMGRKNETAQNGQSHVRQYPTRR